MTLAGLLTELSADERECYWRYIKEHLLDVVVQVPERSRREIFRHVDELVDVLVSEGYEPRLVADLVCDHLYEFAEVDEGCAHSFDCSGHWRNRTDEPPNRYSAKMREWFEGGDELVAHAQLVAHDELWVLATTLEDAERAREELLSAENQPEPDDSPPMPEPIGSTVVSHAPPAPAVRGAMARRLLSEVDTAAA